jgi:hypothetical protein
MDISKDAFAEAYYALETGQLAFLYGVSRMTIWRKATKLGLSKHSKKRADPILDVKATSKAYAPTFNF